MFKKSELKIGNRISGQRIAYTDWVTVSGIITAVSFDGNSAVLDIKTDEGYADWLVVDFEPETVAPVPAWQNEPATAKQIDYLVSLGVAVENGMTKSQASTLIGAAKSGDLGSFGGRYADGSY